MSIGYVRRYYGVPAKRGGRVAWDRRDGTMYGTITRATNYVYIRFDGEKHSRPLHPMEIGLRYLPTATANGEESTRG